MYRRGDWNAPAPAQSAFRIAVLGGVGVVLFTIAFFRLWYLQVLSGDDYKAEAQNNQVREFTIQAPRGQITDRGGQVLVDNRTALELQVKRTDLPDSPKRRAKLFRHLGTIAHLRPEQIRHKMRAEAKECVACPATLRRDVSYDTVYYLRENQGRFPGVSVERVFVRQYPQGTLAAHLLGYVGEVTENELDDPGYQGLEAGDKVGKQGVEFTYDSLLRGTNGMTRVQVDASGEPTGRQLSETEPRPGNNLALSIDDEVQQAGEDAIASFGLPGGFVAMNVHNGELLGIGSSPSYDPSIFAKPLVPQSTYRALTSEANGAPLLNRATQGLYPTGSTFKPITAVAALDSGTIGIGTIINDGGSFDLGDGNVLHNAGGAANGPIDLRTALKVSSDVFFYNLGWDMDVDSGEGGPLQEWAGNLGIGQPTGLDVGGEGAGSLPTPGEVNEHYKDNTAPDSPCGKEVCISEGELTDKPWTIGDNVNLAVGQGGLQADPLQMAVAYGAIGNGGDIVRPHVALRVEDPQGHVVQEIDPAPRRHVDIDPAWRQTILDGLHGAAQEPGGTSYPVFGGYPVDVAGKTGTAERPPHGDQSWYVVLAPYPEPKYVVAVTVEEGGFGVDSAAPAAQQILNALLHVAPGRIEQTGSTAGAYE
ncbi:MAG TPA: penicillin-binding protein 2 [Solirubrobacterales bacterium]|nr:penicillin-binding protein 2 [Solirubrobacterales bacterium]